MLLNDMEKEDLSGKFWIKMNYTYDIDEPFFTVYELMMVLKFTQLVLNLPLYFICSKLTRFDVREGEQDNNFHGDIDRVWSESNGWPVDIVLSFPDIGMY